MVWVLLLCHFVADYPLQTDAIVVAKKQALGLAAHVTIHFITMVVALAGVLQIDIESVLPGILALTGFHFAIDTWKNILSKIRPDWVIFTYLQDQVLHIISIALIALWMESSDNTIAGLSESAWIVPAIALVLATHVWFITERVLVFKSPDYQQWVTQHSWPRMIGRALMLAAFMIGWNIWAFATFAAGLLHHWLDLRGPYHRRALLIDIGVVTCLVLGLNISG